MRNAMFVLWAAMVGLLWFCIMTIWECTEIALYGIHQKSIVDMVTALLLAISWVHWIWRYLEESQ